MKTYYKDWASEEKLLNYSMFTSKSIFTGNIYYLEAIKTLISGLVQMDKLPKMNTLEVCTVLKNAWYEHKTSHTIPTCIFYILLVSRRVVGLCAYVCMYIYIYVCMYVCMKYMHIRMYICMYICMDKNVCMFECTYVCIYVCMCGSVNLFVCLCVFLSVCLCVYLSIYLSVRMCTYSLPRSVCV